MHQTWQTQSVFKKTDRSLNKTKDVVSGFNLNSGFFEARGKKMPDLEVESVFKEVVKDVSGKQKLALELFKSIYMKGRYARFFYFFVLYCFYQYIDNVNEKNGKKWS